MSYQGIAVSGELYYSTGDENLHDFSQLQGDVNGLIGSTSVTALVGVPLPTGAPTTGQIIKYDGSEWAYAPDASGTGLTPHQLLGPDHSDTATASPVRGSLIVGNATPEWDALTLGIQEFVLYSDGTDAVYTRLGQNTPFENGTALLPSVTFTGDTTTGAFLNASGILGLTAAADELITLNGTTTQVTIDAGLVHQTTAIAVDTTLTAADYVVMVTAAAVEVTLPATPTEGQTYVIKDRDGLSTGANKIIVEGNGNNIDGNSFIRINNRYGSVTLVYSGSEWNLI